MTAWNREMSLTASQARGTQGHQRPHWMLKDMVAAARPVGVIPFSPPCTLHLAARQAIPPRVLSDMQGTTDAYDAWSAAAITSASARLRPIAPLVLSYHSAEV